MSEVLLRMHIPGMIGVQNVHPRDQKLWEGRGGYLLPDETQEEKDAAATLALADKQSLKISEQAQKDADAIRLKDEAERLKTEADAQKETLRADLAAKAKFTPLAADPLK